MRSIIARSFSLICLFIKNNIIACSGTGMTIQQLCYKELCKIQTKLLLYSCCQNDSFIIIRKQGGMGQIAALELVHQVDNQETENYLMTKVFTFASEFEANRCVFEFSKEKSSQLWYEIQIFSIQKLYSGVQQQWKVVVSIEYPQKSLRSVIIQNRKNKDAIYYDISKLFLILELTAQFVLIFSSSMCEHLDIYAYLFHNKHKIKICNPKLLYKTCNRRDCMKQIDKSVIMKQILELVLMEKVVEINYWRIMRKVHDIYGNQMLDNLIGNLLKEESDLKVIISDYLQIKEESKKTKNFLIFNQNTIVDQHPKTPYFPTTQFVAFPKPQDTEQSQSGFNIYKKAISESIVREDSFREYQIQPEQEQFHYLPIQQPHQKSMQLVHVTREEQEGKFQGYQKQGKKQGRGKFYYKNGMIFDGFWQDDKKNGQGIVYDREGQLCFKGTYKDDMQDGEGEIVNHDPSPIEGAFNYQDLSLVFEKNLWKRYKGAFKKDWIDGEGTLVLSNNEQFIGNWREGKAEGRGQFTTIFGKVIKGVWCESLFEGKLESNSSKSSISHESQS